MVKEIFNISQQVQLEEINKSIDKNMNEFMTYFLYFQTSWMKNAYSSFKDMEKYLILVYLVNKTFVTYNRHFYNVTFDQFYSNHEIILEKISIKEIIDALGMSKETARRKINELSKDGVILRNSKKIIINQKAFVYQRPDNLLDNFSALTQLVTKNLNSKHNVNRFSAKDISRVIRANFTHYWNTVLDYQLKYISTFLPVLKSYDSTLIYALCISNHNYNLRNKRDNTKIIDRFNYPDFVTAKDTSKGINSTTISDLSEIPRATVIRKLKYMTANKILKKVDNLYSITGSGQEYDKILKIYDKNQTKVRELLRLIINLLNQ